ncbi:hypothetical protein HG531_009586 [Fusarium graminearum]|nr:hypothetical protein HG531_009586 [Fusarium graminearum]
MWLKLTVSMVSLSEWISDDLLEEGAQTSIDIVSDDTSNGLGTRLDITSHILVEHGLDGTTFALVLVEYGTTTEKTGLLARVPVELDSVGCFTRCNTRVAQEDTEGLEDSNSSRSIVIYDN